MVTRGKMREEVKEYGVGWRGTEGNKSMAGACWLRRAAKRGQKQRYGDSVAPLTLCFQRVEQQRRPPPKTPHIHIHKNTDKQRRHPPFQLSSLSPLRARRQQRANDPLRAPGHRKVIIVPNSMSAAAADEQAGGINPH